MLSGLELRFANALRARIEEEMGEYITNLDSIPVGEPAAIAMRFLEARAEFNAFEEVLSWIDEIQEQVGE